MSFSYLGEKAREQLRQLPFPVALPKQLPPGWSLQPFEAYHDIDDGDTSIEIAFQGPDQAAWSVMTTDGGMGDTIPGETDHMQKVVEHPAFGQFILHSFREDEKAEVASDWFPEEEGAAYYHAFRGVGVSPQDLQALIDSLELYEEV